MATSRPSCVEPQFMGTRSSRLCRIASEEITWSSCGTRASTSLVESGLISLQLIYCAPYIPAYTRVFLARILEKLVHFCWNLVSSERPLRYLNFLHYSLHVGKLLKQSWASLNYCIILQCRFISANATRRQDTMSEDDRNVFYVNVYRNNIRIIAHPFFDWISDGVMLDT